MEPSPFTDIQIFQRTVELGSIRAVARELGVEPSSISRRLRRLEQRLGTQLLDRSQNQSRPTESGTTYYEHMRVLMAQIEAVEGRVAGEAEIPKGLLKVNAAIDFGQRYIARWLLDFREQHPQVDVELSLSSRAVDIVAEGIDVAVRIGVLRDSALKARRLAEVPRVQVAAPSYLQRRGVPAHPKDLEEHDHVFYAAANRLQPLVLTDATGREYRVQRSGGVTINSVTSIVDAVERGAGIHIGPLWAFQDAIRRGTVVPVLSDYTQAALPMSAVWAQATLLPARIRAFVDFLVERVDTVPGLEVKR